MVHDVITCRSVSVLASAVADREQARLAHKKEAAGIPAASTTGSATHAIPAIGTRRLSDSSRVRLGADQSIALPVSGYGNYSTVQGSPPSLGHVRACSPAVCPAVQLRPCQHAPHGPHLRFFEAAF